MWPALVRARRHGMEPLITLTSLSDRCFDSTVPLLFDRDRSDEAARADACHRQLLEAGQREGFVPYRLGVQSMRQMIDPEAPCWRMVAALKRAMDPHDILAPGRYSPAPPRQSWSVPR
jgi:4-cresol dehydrogenase (hydroxylating)